MCKIKKLLFHADLLEEIILQQLTYKQILAKKEIKVSKM